MDEKFLRRTKYPLKKRIVCRKCFTVFENTSTKHLAQCPNCGRMIDARIRTEYSKIYSKKYPERIKKYKEYHKRHSKERGKITRDRVRRVNFNIISGNNPVCANCGCNDERLLEINHLKGGGNKELRRGKYFTVFNWDIYMGRRNTEDLNLLCRPCNALHYLELKYGKLPYKIIWRKNVQNR